MVFHVGRYSKRIAASWGCESGIHAGIVAAARPRPGLLEGKGISWQPAIEPVEAGHHVAVIELGQAPPPTGLAIGGAAGGIAGQAA